MHVRSTCTYILVRNLEAASVTVPDAPRLAFKWWPTFHPAGSSKFGDRRRSLSRYKRDLLDTSRSIHATQLRIQVGHQIALCSHIWCQKDINRDPVFKLLD